MGSSAAWKQLLLNAVESNSHLKHSSYFQLATIGSNGKPSNRTVVFRGFQDDSDNIQINTDTRTRKVEDLKHCPYAEMCWYFTDSWEQFRINGSVDTIDASNPDPLKLQQREKTWFASSLRSRLQYLGPTPGIPSVAEETSTNPHIDPSAGPVDYLNLKSSDRLIFTSTINSDGETLWNSEKINP
ncbi:hypothetical protein Leryth_025640 [Lithospermum erythrorhizon]|nr:hypothetical protein Leryth_025640 [Lithospermum erythrorhizon]